ncbi:MAG TPA: methyltransferase domain-containing protein [Ktedonobacteraceae bacterium]|nr:methyltransferase domain-containing protein [Ktedonobacteraceae bacterium]
MLTNIHSMLLPEISRRQIQQRCFSQILSGLIPEIVPTANIRDVLEPVCGPGAWVIEAARAYPQWQVTGLDADPDMLRVAAENSYGFGLDNLLFQRCDIRKTALPYASESFDFLQMQNVNAYIRAGAWPRVMRELLRVLRPGGWLHLVDMELGPVSSPALTRLAVLAAQVVAKMNHENKVRRTFSSALQYHRWLVEAGCQDVKQKVYPIKLGGFEDGDGIALILARLAEDSKAVALLRSMNLIDGCELDILLKDVRHEIQEIDFCGSLMLISITATRPRLLQVSR